MKPRHPARAKEAPGRQGEASHFGQRDAFVSSKGYYNGLGFRVVQNFGFTVTVSVKGLGFRGHHRGFIWLTFIRGLCRIFV